MRSLIFGNLLVYKHYIKTFGHLLRLPKILNNYRMIQDIVNSKKDYSVKIDKSIVNDYNQDFKQISKEINELENNREPISFYWKIFLFFTIRFVCIYFAYYKNFNALFFTSILQFYLLPYSFFSASIYFIHTFFLFIGNVLTYHFLDYAFTILVPSNLMPQAIEVNYLFIFLFILIDQIMNFFFTLYSPKGKSKAVPFKRMSQSIVYSFFNTKTYFIVLFLAIRGLKINLIPWLLDALLGISKFITDYVYENYFNIFLYQQHILSHLPYIYSDGHKFHHFLHDVTAFDGHIYGSGAPEEWMLLMLELVPAYFFGLLPPSLSYYVLYMSYTNKTSHTRHLQTDDIYNSNFHADHHYYHTKNFSSISPMDWCMGTMADRKGCEYEGYRLEKIEDEKTIEIKFKYIK